MKKIRVTVWNEYIHERKEERIGKVYPSGIHGAIAEMLGREEDFEIKTATLDMEEHGLSDDVLDNTDVLIWWGHMAHGKVSEEIAEKVELDDVLADRIQSYLKDEYLVVLMTAGPADEWLRTAF